MTIEKRTINIEEDDGAPMVVTWIAEDRHCLPNIHREWNMYRDKILAATPERNVVVQAGGNCGLYPFLYAKFFEKVFTFEPDPQNFYCLAENCKSNKIIKFNTAVAERSGYLGMGVIDPANVGMHKIGEGGITIFGMSIDSLDLKEVSLIHLDIEGYEYEALLGAKETINRCKPTIVLEITEKHQEIESLMKALGYKSHGEFGCRNYLFTPI